MPDQSRLTIVTNGAFAHPMDTTPIDVRYSELIRSPHLAFKTLQIVTHQPAAIDVGPRPARCVVVTNMAGANRDKYPTEAEAAELARQVLLICDADGRPLFELPPAEVGRTPMGGGMAMWLAEGAVLLLKTPAAGVTCIAKVQAFPRGEE